MTEALPTNIFEVVDSGDVEAVKSFLDKQLYVCLEHAARNNDVPMLEVLLRRKSSNFRFEMNLEYGDTLLTTAIKAKAVEAALRLIKCGVSIRKPAKLLNRAENNGHASLTPLMCCLQFDPANADSLLPVAKALIAHGALRTDNGEISTEPGDISIVDEALEAAVNIDSPAYVNLFLDHGAKIDYMEPLEGTPILTAAKVGALQAMLALKRRGASLVLTDKCDAGIFYHYFTNTYYHSDSGAPRKGLSEYSDDERIAIAKELIDAGANAVAADSYGVTPLLAVALTSFPNTTFFQFAEMFLAQGAEMDDWGDFLEGPEKDVLDLAIDDLDEERMRFWIEKARNSDDNIAFMGAASLTQSLHNLIDYNWDHWGQDEDRIIPVASLLLEQGAGYDKTLLLDIAKKSSAPRCNVLYFFLQFSHEHNYELLQDLLLDLSSLPPEKSSLVTDFMRDRQLAFCMGSHNRLRTGITMPVLPTELMEMIADYGV